MRPVSLRSVPISVRLLVIIGVPLLALGAVLGVQVTDARAAEKSARQGLARAEFFRAAAALQSVIVAPELKANGLDLASTDDAPVETRLVLQYVHELITQHAAQAQEALDGVLSRNPGVVNDATASAFARQKAALTPVLAGDTSAAALGRLATARAETDDALTDVFVESGDEPWFTYQAVIELNRTRYDEVSALLPTLSGFGTVSSSQLSVLGGARANAVTRSGFGTSAATREAIKALLAAPDGQAYLRAVALGARIAAGDHAPLSPAEVRAVATSALALSGGEDKISQQVQDRATDVRRAQVTEARRREVSATWIAAVVLLTTSVLAALALRSILVPLRAMTRRAVELAAGRLDGPPVALVGRDELTRLAVALENSAQTLLHVNAQAQAIADGRLDDPSLKRPAPGAFGEVLHGNVLAVQTQAEQLRHDADHDSLTGLLNRAGLERAVGELPATEPGVADRWLLYLDLDGFKPINDTHGHEQGDDVLRAVAQRLLRTVRPGDLVGRLGGDEFVVVVSTSHGSDEVLQETGRRLDQAVRLPVPHRSPDADPVSVGASIGWALFPVGASLEAALAEADGQMYQAKRARKAVRLLPTRREARRVREERMDEAPDASAFEVKIDRVPSEKV